MKSQALSCIGNIQGSKAFLVVLNSSPFSWLVSGNTRVCTMMTFLNNLLPTVEN